VKREEREENLVVRVPEINSESHLVLIEEVFGSGKEKDT